MRGRGGARAHQAHRLQTFLAVGLGGTRLWSLSPRPPPLMAGWTWHSSLAVGHGPTAIGKAVVFSHSFCCAESVAASGPLKRARHTGAPTVGGLLALGSGAQTCTGTWGWGSTGGRVHVPSPAQPLREKVGQDPPMKVAEERWRELVASSSFSVCFLRLADGWLAGGSRVVRSPFAFYRLLLSL